MSTIFGRWKKPVPTMEIRVSSSKEHVTLEMVSNNVDLLEKNAVHPAFNEFNDFLSSAGLYISLGHHTSVYNICRDKGGEVMEDTSEQLEEEGVDIDDYNWSVDTVYIPRKFEHSRRDNAGSAYVSDPAGEAFRIIFAFIELSNILEFKLIVNGKDMKPSVSFWD